MTDNMFCPARSGEAPQSGPEWRIRFRYTRQGNEKVITEIMK